MKKQPDLYLDVAAFEAADEDPAVLGLAMKLVVEVWYPSRAGFQWNPERLAAQIKAPDVTSQALEEARDRVAKFFTVLDDGRWVPSPEFFSMTDGNRETPQ